MLNLSCRHLCSHRVTSRTYQIDSHTPAFFTPSGDRGRRQASLAMATHPAAYPLLPSAPLPSRHLVDNPNLPGWLEECREVSLVLALAPAGFGKTTAMLAIHEHLGNDGFATAWIQLSAEDNHFERFCTVVLEACGQRLPDTGTNTHVPNLMDARYTGSKLGQMLLESLAALRAPTALFLDDDLTVLTAYRRALSSDEVSGEYLTSADQAARRIAAPDPPDVVVTDLVMPGMTGMELYRRALELDPTWRHRFVFITGAGTLAHVAEFLRRVEGRALTKPVDIRRLRDAIRYAATGARIFRKHSAEG